MSANNYVIFQNSNYRTWLLARFIGNFAKAMQMLIVFWQVYEIARRPLALGYIGLAEAIPFVLMGLWAGHSADRYEKKSQILGSAWGLLVCALCLLFLSKRAEPTLLPIYFVMGVVGFFSSFEFASTSSYVQMIIPEEHFSKAAAWNLFQFQLAMIIGPLTAGWILARHGVLVGYGVVAGLFLMSFLFSTQLKPLGVHPGIREMAGWDSIKIGLKYLLTQRLILACMVLDMVAVFFGDVIAILPVFAEMFNVGPLGLGALRAAPATGALLLSLIQANRPFIRINWKNFLITVAAFGLCMISFSLSTVFWLAVLFLMGSGFADGVSVIIRQSLYQAHTPGHLRGRITSVSSIFIRFSNEMGVFESGLAAQLLGAVPSVILGGCLTLSSVLFMKIKYRDLEKES